MAYQEFGCSYIWVRYRLEEAAVKKRGGEQTIYSMSMECLYIVAEGDALS